MPPQQAGLSAALLAAMWVTDGNHKSYSSFRHQRYRVAGGLGFFLKHAVTVFSVLPLLLE